jgi:hypothetical protein
MEHSTHRSCVITPGAVYYGNGSMTSLRNGLAADLRAILAGVAGRFVDHATIIIDGAPVETYRGQGGAARALGWNHREIGPWTVFHRSDGRTLALGIRESMVPQHHFGVLFDRHTDPGTLAMVLDRYQQVTGCAWRGTFATTSLNALRLSWADTDQQPRWRIPRDRRLSGAGRLEWRRELTSLERSWGWVHTFDAVRAYLAAATSVEVAWSELERTGERQFDPRVPGYWWLALPPELLATLDDPLRPPVVRRVVDGVTQVTTPYAGLLYELAPGCRVVDSLTGRVQGRGRVAGFRVLRAWAEQLRDAFRLVEAMPGGQLRDVLTVAVKRTYKDAVGGMQRDGMRVVRADWAHTLIDYWAANMYRRILGVHESQGVWPVAVKTDSLSYADCVQAPQPRPASTPWATLSDELNVAACSVGCGCARLAAGPLGTFRHESTATAAGWRAA